METLYDHTLFDSALLEQYVTVFVNEFNVDKMHVWKILRWMVRTTSMRGIDHPWTRFQYECLIILQAMFMLHVYINTLEDEGTDPLAEHKHPMGQLGSYIATHNKIDPSIVTYKHVYQYCYRLMADITRHIGESNNVVAQHVRKQMKKVFESMAIHEVYVPIDNDHYEYEKSAQAPRTWRESTSTSPVAEFLDEYEYVYGVYLPNVLSLEQGELDYYEPEQVNDQLRRIIHQYNVTRLVLSRLPPELRPYVRIVAFMCKRLYAIHADS